MFSASIISSTGYIFSLIIKIDMNYDEHQILLARQELSHKEQEPEEALDAKQDLQTEKGNLIRQR